MTSGQRMEKCIRVKRRQSAENRANPTESGIEGLNLQKDSLLFSIVVLLVELWLPHEYFCTIGGRDSEGRAFRRHLAVRYGRHHAEERLLSLQCDAWKRILYGLEDRHSNSLSLPKFVEKSVVCNGIVHQLTSTRPRHHKMRR